MKNNGFRVGLCLGCACGQRVLLGDQCEQCITEGLWDSLSREAIVRAFATASARLGPAS